MRTSKTFHFDIKYVGDKEGKDDRKIYLPSEDDDVPQSNILEETSEEQPEE